MIRKRQWAVWSDRFPVRRGRMGAAVFLMLLLLPTQMATGAPVDECLTITPPGMTNELHVHNRCDQSWTAVLTFEPDNAQVQLCVPPQEAVGYPFDVGTVALTGHEGC